MIGVVDTSALIRMFIPDGPAVDGLESFMNGVERGRNTALAPELLLAEAANVILKKSQRGELNAEEAKLLAEDVISMPIKLFAHKPLIQPSMDLANTHRLTVYDALFLALALQHSAVLFSADEKLLAVADRLNLTP